MSPGPIRFGHQATVSSADGPGSRLISWLVIFTRPQISACAASSPSNHLSADGPGSRLARYYMYMLASNQASLEPRPSSPPDLRPSGRGPGKTSILFGEMDHIHQAWEWWYNGGRVPFFGKAVCILCIIFVLTFSKGSAFALL